MRISTFRTTCAATAAAGLTVLAVGPALAADLAEPKTTTDNGVTVLKLDDTQTSGKFIPKGGSPTTGSPKAKPKPGDAFSFTDDLRQGGVLVGTDAGRCTIVDADNGKGMCDVTVTFAGGTVHIVGPTTFNNSGAPSTLPLQSGTGAYQGISGTATVVDLTDAQDPSDTKSTITVRYTLAGGQVAQVPSGGAATGGGFSGNGAPIALFGLAGGALLAGTGILEAGRRARRG